LPSPITNGVEREEPAVRIGSAVIRAGGTPVYVIAEAGVNHNGDVRAAMAMVDAAVGAGAGAVKFQAFRASALVTAGAAAAQYQREQAKATTQIEMLRSLELPAGAFAAIARHCRNAGIEFLATPFGVDDLKMLVDLGARAIKIASPDITNVPLLVAAAETGLPLIVSTGAAQPVEIDRAVALLDRHGARGRLVLLHCVSSYPTREADANLRRVCTLAGRYGRPAGFSDHTASIGIGALATAAGAAVLEKHFTLDRTLPGPDQSFSLEPAQLAEYIAGVRRAEAALGCGNLGLLDTEWEVRRLSRCSVVAAGFIAKGQRIDPDTLTVKRPGTGIPPADLDRVAGRIADVDIPADTLIQWEMLR
jgi:N,N'-diacetyllegionaminate synthase